MIPWAKAVVVGLMGGVCTAGLLTATSGELAPLVAFNISDALQIPGLILIGLLMGLATPNLGRAAAAFFLAVTTAASLHVLLYAIPGLDTVNYTTARFNNGLATSLFVFLVGGIFILIGQGIAVAVNVFGRGLND